VDPVFAIMLDVARIVTFQPNAANTETRRIGRERELRSTGGVSADESAPAAAHVTKQEQVRLRRWFRFAFMPR
jgi:hypothetical protein